MARPDIANARFVEGEPGIFPDPIARIYRTISSWLRRRFTRRRD